MKNNKIVLFTVLILLISCSVFATYGTTDNTTIKVYLNGDLIKFDTEPEIVNGTTMVPLRGIFEPLKMKVGWNNTTQMITAEKEGLAIVLKIGSDKAEVNGADVKIMEEAYITSGRTMVPLRFIAESTGATVNWDASTKSISISSTTDETVVTEGASNTPSIPSKELTYKIVDTGVTTLFTDKRTISNISEGSPFYGQDGNYNGYQPSYTDNKNGTVTDNVTGLMWQQTMASKMTYDAALAYANASKLGGYDDWRIPTIKELFSLILFTGESGGEVAKVLYIDTDYFDQPIGDTSIGEREIDAQTWSRTKYVGKTMEGNDTVFGVNFIDGRIKGYGLLNPVTRDDYKGYFRLVRGNESYGENEFIDNQDGTITDLATGLMWQMADDGQTRDWEDALSYAENLTLAGYDDWRLPNVKELQSLVDYTKSMQTTGTAAINDLFVLSKMKDPDGHSNYGFYWTSTTHQDGINTADSASYVAFGEAQGKMREKLMDVHGAGAVRSDPKSGDLSDYPSYFGPQGDIRYVYNYVLAVRDVQ